MAEEEYMDEEEFQSIGEAIRDGRANKPKGRKERKSKESQSLDPVGISFYGAENFKGWNRVTEIVGLIPLWKEFYYETRIKDANVPVAQMLREFNQKHAYPDS